MNDPTLPEYLADGDAPVGWTANELTLVDYDPSAEVPIPARFRVDDDSAAAWAMRKLRAIRKRQDSNRMIAEDEIDRIQCWLDDVNRPLDDHAAYFEGILRDYALRVRENPDDGRKTLNLPAGKVSTRPGADRWEIDADAFLPWARTNHPDLIRVKEEPALAEIKATILVDNETAHTDDGEVVPGITITPQPVSVSFKTAD